MKKINSYFLITRKKIPAYLKYYLAKKSEEVRLPSEYQQVEYIESTGTQYIDTGITPDTTLEFDTTFNTSNNFSQDIGRYGCIFGSRISSAKSDVQLTTYSEFGYKGTIRCGNNYGDNAWLSNNVKINAKLKNNMYYVDNTEIRSITIEVSSVYNIYIFALNQSGTAIQNGKLKLYTFKLWKNDVLVRNFIPCYRKSDNEIGLYDIVNNVFYTNQGTGEFLKGNSVQEKLPNKYQQVEYIESTGTQYIDTGINVNTTTSRYETKINPSLVSDTMGIFGTRNYISSNQSSMNVFIINGAFRLDWLTGEGSYNVGNISSNTEYTISITRGLATINNVDYTSEATPSINSLYTFYIGNFNNAGSVYSNGFSGKIYYSKLYNNNILVFDGVPCYRKSDNLTGMYDLVSNTFFTNSGTGKFIAGGDV